MAGGTLVERQLPKILNPLTLSVRPSKKRKKEMQTKNEQQCS